MTYRTVESTIRINVRQLRKNGVFDDIGRRIFSNGITHRDKKIGELRVMHVDGVIYVYETASGSEAAIRLTTSPQHLGGVRYWFVCSGCGSRRGVLHAPCWQCRECCGLVHYSTREQPYWRARDIAQQIVKTLNPDGDCNILEFDHLPPKPKGMHWTTYKRLEAKHRQLVQRYRDGYLGVLAWHTRGVQ